MSAFLYSIDEESVKYRSPPPLPRLRAVPVRPPMPPPRPPRRPRSARRPTQVIRYAVADIPPPPTPNAVPVLPPALPPPRPRPTDIPGLNSIYTADLSKPQPRGYVARDFPACHYSDGRRGSQQAYMMRFHRRTLSIRGMDDILEERGGPMKEEEPRSVGRRPLHWLR